MGGRLSLTAGASLAPIPVAAAEPDVDQPRRIGILGGTFDPPHLGHLVLAMTAAGELALDRVLFMPAGAPPHKREGDISSPTDRLLLTRLAIAGDECFELSAFEIERAGTSYTVETAEALLDAYGASARLFIVMAADSLSQIDTWREPDRLLDLAEWAVGPRPGWPLPSRDALMERWGERHERIHLLEGPSLAISSSELRGRVAAGRSIRYLVPRAVEEQIAARRLYQR